MVQWAAFGGKLKAESLSERVKQRGYRSVEGLLCGPLIAGDSRIPNGFSLDPPRH